MKLMKMKNLGLLGLLAIMILAGCRQDKEVITDTVIFGNEPVVYVNTSITGVVSDEMGSPLSNVSIQVDGFNASSDDNGFFYLKDIDANKNGTSVKFEKSGFFNLSKLIYPELNRVEFVQVIMTSSDENGRFSAAAGGEIDLGQGAKVTFPANAIAKDGASYDGEVIVHATFLEPQSDDLIDRMPGSLIGVNNEGSVVGMRTFGMMGVELFDDAGSLLEVAPGEKATLTFPLPDVLQAVAEANIDLWHFDEKSAYWVQEGQARLENGAYIAEVSHFSFWNCDAPFELVNVRGKIETASGQPVANSKVEISSTVNPAIGTGSAFTNRIGIYNGKIPANEELVLTVYDLCGEVVATKNIGPFSSNADLGTVEVSFPSEITVSGRLVNCQGEPVQNGYAYIRVDGPIGSAVSTATTDDQGEFSSTMGVCGEGEVVIVGHDLDALEKSDEQLFGFDKNLDVGSIEACGNVIYTMTITIDNVTKVIENCFARVTQDSIGGPLRDVLYLGAEGNEGYINMQIPEATSTGAFDVAFFNGVLLARPNENYQNPEIEVVITQFDNAPGLILGTFEGSVLEEGSGNTLEVSGSFKAERR